MEPAARRAFLAAVRGAVGIVDIGELVEAIGSGQMSQVEAAAKLDALSNDLRARLLPVIGQTFTLGLAAGAEAANVEPAITFGFDLVNPESIAWVVNHGAELVTEVGLSTKHAIQWVVERGILDGVAPDRLASRLMEVVGLRSDQVVAVERFRERLIGEGVSADAVDRRTGRYAEAQLRRRAFVIARQETMTAANEGQYELFQAAKRQGDLDPATTRRVWIVTHDDRLDAACERFDEAEAPLDGPFPGGILNPPLHIQCLTGDTLVTPVGAIAAVTERRYDGDLVIIRTARGEHLACTPNHPILTERGWISAGALHVGAYVLGCRVRDGMSGVGLNDEHRPSRIHEIAEAARRSPHMFASPMPLTDPDFHGDGRGSEVAIIWTDRSLRDREESVLLETFMESALVARHAPGVFDAQRDLTAVSERLERSAHRSMRGGRLRAALSRGHPRPLQAFGFGLGSTGETEAAEDARDDRPRNGIGQRQRQLRLAPSVSSGDLSLWNVPPWLGTGRFNESNGDAALTETRQDDRQGNMEILRDACRRLAGEISPDRVIHVECHSYSGHIYNLQTEYGIYIANGIVTHNCRCTTGLVFK